MMHIKKNIYDNLIGILLNLDGKSKNNLKVHLDLKKIGIKQELHPKELANDKVYIPLHVTQCSLERKFFF